MTLLFHVSLYLAFILGCLIIAASAQQTATVPSVLPGNWTSMGCFTDVSTSRTLAATFTSGDNMTIESCIGFCTGGGYIFAGVEFGHCDSTIQIPSQPAALSDCNSVCGGNSTETCGGSNRLNVFFSGGQSPTLVPSIASGAWNYQGCYTDIVSNRTLNVPVNIPGGVTAESCTAACQSLGGYKFAGLEIGRECWCDNTVNSPAQHVSDNDCRQICNANHAEYCGNTNRIAVYSFGALSSGPSVCQNTDLGASKFTLQAVFRNGAQAGQTVPVKAIAVEIVKNVEWTILSTCTNCCTEWPTFSLSNSIVFPQSIVVPGQLMSSTAPNDGESPNFVASNPAFPGVQAYCTMADPTNSLSSAPALLALGGKSDSFALCANNTANGRMDVVFSPVTGHPHYDLSACSSVNIQIINS